MRLSLGQPLRRRRAWRGDRGELEPQAEVARPPAARRQNERAVPRPDLLEKDSLSTLDLQMADDAANRQRKAQLLEAGGNGSRHDIFGNCSHDSMPGPFLPQAKLFDSNRRPLLMRGFCQAFLAGPVGFRFGLFATMSVQSPA